jgi:hypothetical protein
MTILCNYEIGSGNTYGSWNINLQGYTGATGAAGSAGTSGINGSSGSSGVNGSSGTSGTSGSSGTSGDSGSSGTSGTSGTSGVSITGPTGPTGAAGSGGGGTYYVLVAFSSGNLIGSNASYPTATCFIEAEDPNGSSLLGASGWTFTKNAAQEFTIGHPTGKFALDFNRIVENTSGTYLTASVGVNSTTGNYIQQVTLRNSINVKGLSNTFTGINSAASGGSGSGGEWLFYLTWQFPSTTF